MKSIKGIIVFLFIFGISTIGWAYTETFYLSAAGDASAPETIAGAWDMSDVSTDGTHWDTDDQDDGKIGPNDRLIVLDDDGVFRAALVVQQSGLAGKPITIVGETGGSQTINVAVVLTTWNLEGGTVYSKLVAVEPVAVWYDDEYLTENDTATTTVGANEWDWAVDTLYVNVGENPDTGILETGTDTYGASCEKNYITIQGLTFKHATNFRSGARLVGTGITLSDCTFTKNNHGIYGGEVTNLLVYNNLSYSNEGNGIRIITSTGTGNVVRSNTLYSNGSDGIFLSAALNITIENNTSYSNGSHGILVFNTSTGAIIRYNRVYGSTNSNIKIQDSDNSEIYYNVVSGSVFDHLDIQLFSSTGCSIYNNTTYGGYDGIGILSASTGATIKNNISSEHTSYALNVSADSVANITINNNCYFSTVSKYANYNGTTYTTFVTYQAAVLPQESNSIGVNPLMVDPANDDFTLQSFSPCVNAGIDVGLTHDYSGNKIIGEPDMGAYEHQSRYKSEMSKVEMIKAQFILSSFSTQ